MQAPPRHSTTQKAPVAREQINVRKIIPEMERTFLSKGEKIGKYRIIEEIDRGGMAVVYKAVQLDLDRIVALKVLPANVTINRRFVERFISEAQAIARLNHPNIVSIHEVAVEKNIYYLVMDYVPGQSLYYYLNFSKPKLVDVMEIMIKLADALDYAHKKRIIHRDLKLNNVIMKNKTTPVLIDFGLAKAMEAPDDNLTKTGEIMGSPAYMAPERLLGGQVDARSDICSLGIMLYEMLTFKNPYLDQRSIHQTTINIIESKPISPRKLVTWLPVEIEAITLKAMAKEPELRYQTMGEFREDLQRYQRGEPVVARPPSRWTSIQRFLRRHASQCIVLLIVAGFTGLFGLTRYVERKKEQSHWRLVYEEAFDGPHGMNGWVVDPKTENTAVWQIEKEGLRASCLVPTHIRLDKQFTRDIKIEFTVRLEEGTYHDVGVFVYGEEPHQSYRFTLHHNGTHRHGLLLPGSDLVVSSYDPVAVKNSRTYRIALEKKNNTFVYRVNGMTILSLPDPFPPLGFGHRTIGFFLGNGTYTFDNLRVYRQAIPLVPVPTLTADRLLERGEITTALKEYRELLLDFSDSPDITAIIRVRIADCLIRMKRFLHAQETLDRILNNSTGSTDCRSDALYLQGILYDAIGADANAEISHYALIKLFPASTAARAAIYRLALRAWDFVRNNEHKKGRRIIERLSHLVIKAPAILPLVHLRLADHLASMHLYDAALKTCNTIITAYDGNDAATARALGCIARIHLEKREYRKAVQVYNRIVNTYRSREPAWDAWLNLARIYEFDGDIQDARIIYRKIRTECPAHVSMYWEAQLRLAQSYLFEGDRNSARVLYRRMAASPPPFTREYMIARHNNSDMTRDEFLSTWLMLYKDDPRHLHVRAQKSLLDGDREQALAHLHSLSQSMDVYSWDRRYLDELIKRIEKPGALQR